MDHYLELLFQKSRALGLDMKTAVLYNVTNQLLIYRRIKFVTGMFLVYLCESNTLRGDKI